MKKTLVFVWITLILLSISGCQKNNELAVWSFTDELDEMIKKYYIPAHPSGKVKYNFILTSPTDQFDSSLDSVLQSGIGAPDVFGLESAFVRKYVESGYLLDLTDIYDRNKDKLLYYPVEVGTYKGKVYALSWQASPGAMFYRRSFAKKYLGTDDPDVVQTYFDNLQKFIDTARLLKERSNGACVVISSIGDLQYLFYNTRKDPWIVNNRLVIDPVLERYFEVAKTLHDNGWEGRVSQWSEAWTAGMRDGLIDENGNPVEVFSYFLPTWGLSYALKNNASGTSGDWAMCPGPVPFRLGGSWVGAWKDTKNPEAAKQLIEWLTTDDGFLENWAKDRGDLVSNMAVINRIKDGFSDPFLDGQNYYAVFAGIALNVSDRLVQGTDSIIQALFQKELASYVKDEKTRAQALDDFSRQIKDRLDLN